jgi:hypothetical protein
MQAIPPALQTMFEDHLRSRPFRTLFTQDLGSKATSNLPDVLSSLNKVSFF